MRAGPRGLRRAVLGLIAGAAVVLLCATPAYAQDSGPKVLLVEAEAPPRSAVPRNHSELAARIAGQTRDLPLRLESASTVEPDFDQGRAQALA